MTQLVKKTLVFWVLLILLSYASHSWVFQCFFPKLEIDKLPGSGLYFPVTLTLIFLAMRIFLIIKALHLLATKTMDITDEEAEDQMDEELSKSKINYFLFPLAILLGCLYGAWIAVTTTGIVFFEGMFKMAIVNLLFILPVFFLIRKKLITNWLLVKLQASMERGQYY